jgi:hypothetical protein
MKKPHIILASTLWLSINSSGAFAFPIAAPGTEGLEVVVNSTDPVVATYQGNSASYSNDLYLLLDASGKPGDDGNPANDLFIFNNHSSPEGSKVTLGSFPVGTKLIFRIHVNDEGTDYFTGPANRNPDSHTHARAQKNWTPNETLVSFEDLNGGPFDYNDLSFSFTNSQAALAYTIIQSIRISDLNNNSKPEEATLSRNNTAASMQVSIRDSTTKTLLKTISYGTASSYTPVGLAEVPDLNGNGKPEIAVLFRNETTGIGYVAIRDSSTAAIVKQISFGAVSAQSVTVLEDTDGNGTPEIAVALLVPATQAFRLDVRDALSGALVRSIALP